MAQVLVNDSSLEDIADAIREKSGGSDTYLPSQMAGAIRSIPTGVTGVKGDQESAYRTGDVNLTPANIGAVAASDAVTGVKGGAESTYRKGQVSLNPANIGAKSLQTAVSDPSPSGDAYAFIDTISQNEQGKISVTKKYVPDATADSSGLMSKTDKNKLDATKEISIQTQTISELTIGSHSAVNVFPNTSSSAYKYISAVLEPQLNASPDLVVGTPYYQYGEPKVTIYNTGNSSCTLSGTLTWIRIKN